jgi:hypothetical protein
MLRIFSYDGDLKTGSIRSTLFTQYLLRNETKQLFKNFICLQRLQILVSCHQYLYVRTRQTAGPPNNCDGLQYNTDIWTHRRVTNKLLEEKCQFVDLDVEHLGTYAYIEIYDPYSYINLFVRTKNTPKNIQNIQKEE